MESEPTPPPSELKIHFSDANNHMQYDSSAARIAFYNVQVEEGAKSGSLYLGDRDSCSMVQLKHRGIKDCVICEEDMFGTFLILRVSVPAYIFVHISLPFTF